jgi:hypothetical protein
MGRCYRPCPEERLAQAATHGDHRRVEPEPVLYREEVRTFLWLLGDILRELKLIRRALENGEEEEEDLGE